MSNDISIQVIYCEWRRMKTAVAILETELEGLKKQKERLIATQSPKDVKAVCYDLEKGSGVQMTLDQFFTKVLDITDQIREVEERLRIAKGTLEDSQRMIKKTANDLKDEDRTLVVFQKSVMEGKSIVACAEEMMVSVQTVSYHRGKIYQMIGNEEQTGN